MEIPILRNREAFSTLKVVYNDLIVKGNSYVDGYRYGFQGQERDDQIKGKGNSYNYKYRMDDPRVGRFLSIDPLADKYPFNSPYDFSQDRVIDGVELEGKEFVIATIIIGDAIITLTATDVVVATAIVEAGSVSHQMYNNYHYGNYGNPDDWSYSRPTDWVPEPYYENGGESNRPPNGWKNSKWGALGTAIGLTEVGMTNVLKPYINLLEDNKEDSKEKNKLSSNSLPIVNIFKITDVIKKTENGLLVKGTLVTYQKINKDDNLTKIAKEDGTTVDNLMKLNNISEKNKNYIKAGSYIKVAKQKVEKILKPKKKS